LVTGCLLLLLLLLSALLLLLAGMTAGCFGSGNGA
jgi:hypothetical protein